jgi:hypothetical protein
MPYEHGVKISEVATALQSPVSSYASLPVIIGAAPVWQVDGGTADLLNIPTLCTTLEEFQAAFGDSDDWELYPLCEAADVFFTRYNVGPIVVINTLDPTTMVTAHAAVDAALVAGVYTIAVDDAILSSLVVKSADGNTTYTLTTDYTVAYNTAMRLVVTRVATGTIPAADTALKYEFDSYLGTEMDSGDIEAGIDAVENVYSQTGQVPGQLLAPGWSQQSAIGAALVAEAASINGVFKARAIVDVDSDTGEAETYTAAVTRKGTDSYTDELMVVCWPMVTLSNVSYWMSLHYAAVRCALNAANNDVPYASPSNQRMAIDGLITESGTAVYLNNVQANVLNAGGIVTGLNWSRGWVLWGNESGAYPGSTDPILRWNCVRDMFNWIGNTAILTYWQNVDQPGNPRLIDTVVTSFNQWLNGLTSQGYILGGRCQFLASSNPTVNLIGGDFVFDIDPTPPVPAKSITFRMTYNTEYLSTLFG